MKERVLIKTEIPEGELFSRGKVRDTWVMPDWPDPGGEKRLLMVTTDRISAFDVVMAEGVPDLGKIRNQISLYWFNRLKDVCPNHIFSGNQQLCANFVDASVQQANDLIGRSVLVYRADVFPVECVVRGYLYGSAWEDYKSSGTVCGTKLRSGLREADKLPKPIFTPATKAKTGHDQNIDFDTMVKIVGSEVAEELRMKSLKLYEKAAWWASVCGIIVADTKFEFGLYKGKIIVVDELLTPDSSRFWDLEAYKPGWPQPSFDKQHLRNWLKASGWDKNPPPPPLPDVVIEGMKARYIEAYERLLGNHWPPAF